MLLHLHLAAANAASILPSNHRSNERCRVMLMSAVTCSRYEVPGMIQACTGRRRIEVRRAPPMEGKDGEGATIKNQHRQPSEKQEGLQGRNSHDRLACLVLGSPGSLLTRLDGVEPGVGGLTNLFIILRLAVPLGSWIPPPSKQNLHPLFPEPKELPSQRQTHF